MSKWVTFPFSRGTYQPRDQTQVSWIADRFFTIGDTREAFAELIRLTNGRHLHSSFQRRPSEARFKEWKPFTHANLYQKTCPWTTAIKFFMKYNWVGTYSFEGHTLFPFPEKSNLVILFCFTQASVLETWFSTSAQRLSSQYQSLEEDW